MIEWGQRKTCELVKKSDVFPVENSGITKCVFSNKMSVISKNAIFCSLKCCQTSIIWGWFMGLVAQQIC